MKQPREKKVKECPECGLSWGHGTVPCDVWLKETMKKEGLFQKEPEEWEKEFDKRFGHIGCGLCCKQACREGKEPLDEVKDFIRSQRTQTIEEIRKLVEKDREMFFKQGTTEEQLEEAHKIRKELRREILVDFDSLK